MPDKAQEQDLSIEEILASIRQIISDDDAPAGDKKEEPAAAAPEPVAPPPAPEPETLPAPPEEEDILDLSNPVDELEESANVLTPPRIAMEDIDEPEPPAPVIRDMEPIFELPEKSDTASGEEIFTSSAADATVGAFHKLAENLYIDRPAGPVRRPADGAPTLEDIVRDLLKPMLREWIDRNMPRLVERLVQDELARLARRSRED